MAREVVTTQTITRAGLVPVTGTPTIDGDVVDVGNVFLWVENVGAAAVDVTVDATASQDGLSLTDLVVSVAAGDVALIGPLPARTFAQPTGAEGEGAAHVNYSAPADVARAVISL